MQITIIISEEARQALHSWLQPLETFRQTAERLPDGTWAIPVDEDVYRRLLHTQFKGESISDTILRIASRRQ